ncbi:MAG: hypothetical protein TREMPRED_000199 [Tremellales sp. Tagirdzhanova-0007]|nr:MAG: hypothetical protein TREMPRED_000199 [Tremellales sp. Tagirdzhanova-0007]
MDLDNSNIPSGDPQTEDPSTQPPTSSADAVGNQGQAGQFGQEGQYGAVRGKGFGGGLNQRQGLSEGKEQGQGQPQGQGNISPQDQQGVQGVHDGGPSAYEGMDPSDSTPSGGWGTNEQGSSFARSNQIDADAKPDPAAGGLGEDDEIQGQGYKTGTSTPGYRQEGDVDAQAAENRMRNQNMNVYGQQADDQGSKDNDYNEAN